MADREARIKELEAELDEREATIAELEARIAALTTEPDDQDRASDADSNSGPWRGLQRWVRER